MRGKYIERYREGTNLVLLDPDVAAAFPDANYQGQLKTHYCQLRNSCGRNERAWRSNLFAAIIVAHEHTS
jgi:hypothetical protein